METKKVQQKNALVFNAKSNMKNVGNLAMQHLPKMYETLGKLGLEESEPSVFIYRGATSDMEKEFDFQIALVCNGQKEITGPYQFENLPELNCASYDYKGDISEIGKKYDAIYGELGSSGKIPGNEIREIYHNWVSESSPENEIEIQVQLN